MKFVCEKDYNYIINKYHDASKPFNGHKRWIRNDSIFDTNSGMEPDKIYEGIWEIFEETKDELHPVVKAKVFKYVLDNTRISCDSRDKFPAINMVDRPLNKTIISVWNTEVFTEIMPEIEESKGRLESLGICTAWPDYDHSVPMWDRIFELGFKGIINESERIRAEKERNDEETAFFEGIKITYSAIIGLLERLYKLADKTDGSERMAIALKNIKENPPATFYEALLVSYIFFILCEHIEGLQVRSLGNFDKLFYPYYENDITNGISEEMIKQDLAYYFMQFTAIGNYYNQPVYLSGCEADESTVVNKLSYMFLDVYDEMNIYSPKIQIKVAESTPKKFLCKALDMIRRGNNCIVFVNDSTIRKALVKWGETEEAARLCDINGCYEYTVRGGVRCGMNYLNLLKPLELAMHSGCDALSGEFIGRKSPDVESYKSFDEFYDEYKNQLIHIVNLVFSNVNAYEDYLSYMNPQSMNSGSILSCLEKAKDSHNGGAVSNNTALGVGFLADATDSLTAIKKFVFDKKEISFSKFKDILDSNYDGYEEFRQFLLNDTDKYGNNKELPDSIAVDLVKFVSDYVCGKPNAKNRNGKWSCSFHVARRSYEEAPRTLASPNGRCMGEELSKNCSASMGQNKEGVTAAILSVTKLDATAFPGDACLDLGILPSTVQGEDGLEAMYGLLRTFTSRGGHAMHINVFDSKKLRDAQKYPDKYKDLQIRVCGWNVLWNNINKVEQDGFIRQAESLI